MKKHLLSAAVVIGALRVKPQNAISFWIAHCHKTELKQKALKKFYASTRKVIPTSRFGYKTEFFPSETFPKI